jgi:hypothetical protein
MQKSESLVPNLAFNTARPRVDKNKFRRSLTSFLQDHLVTRLSQRVSDDLFRLTTEYVIQDAIHAKMQTKDSQKDWRSRERLINKIKQQIDMSINELDRSLQCKLKLTSIFAAPVRKRYRELKRLVADAHSTHRLYDSMANALKESRRPGELARTIDHYLKLHCKQYGLSQQQRDTIIEGCYRAGKIYGKAQELQDLVSRIPQQRYKSKEDCAIIERSTRQFLTDQSKRK